MKSNLSKLGLWTLACWLAFASSAGPLLRGDVASEPAWLVHLDVDLFRNTTIGRFLQTEMDKPEAQAKLAAFSALMNFDLRTQLHGLTLYSVGSVPEDGVLIVYADFDPERLVTLAKAAKDSQSSTHNQYTIYSWVDDNKKARDGVKPRTYAAIAGARVIFGQRERSVAQALDVINGNTPNLARETAFPNLGVAGTLSFIQAAARKMDFLQGQPNAQVLRLSKQITLQVGEAQQQLSAALTLQANDEEVANNISSILNGLISLMKLQQENPAARFAQALRSQQDGPVVRLDLTVPANEVVQMIKAGAERNAKKKEAKSGQE